MTPASAETRERLKREAGARRLRPRFLECARRSCPCAWCGHEVRAGGELCWLPDLRISVHVDCLVDLVRAGVA